MAVIDPLTQAPTAVGDTGVYLGDNLISVATGVPAYPFQMVPVVSANDAPVLEIPLATTRTDLLPGNMYRVDTSTFTGSDPDSLGDGSNVVLNYVEHDVPDGTEEGQLIQVSQIGANGIKLNGRINGETDFIYQNGDASRLFMSWNNTSNFWLLSNTYESDDTGGTGTSTTLLALTDTDNSFTPDGIWVTNPAGTSATQVTVLDGGTF